MSSAAVDTVVFTKTGSVALPADVVAAMYQQFVASDGTMFALDQIGREHGLSGAEVQKVMAKVRTAAPAPVPAKRPRRQSRATLSVDQLVANPANIRDDLGDLRDLTASIRETGLLQALIVTEHPGGYLVIDGHRRLAASVAAGLTQLSCTIRHNVAAVSDQVVLMLVANGQRKDLNPVERAQAFSSLVDVGISQAEVARRCGTTESMISDSLTLLELDDETLDQVRAGKISAYQAIKTVRDVRRRQRAATGRPQRGRVPRKQQRMTVSPAEAAALVRLLDGYLDGDRGDNPGRSSLVAVQRRLGKLRQDDSAYVGWRPAGPERPGDPILASPTG